MKNLIIIILLLLSFNLLAQSTGRSESGSLSKKKTVIENSTDKEAYFTPFLVVDLKYSEESGNKFLDANENGNIAITIKNIGKMAAEDCKVKLLPNNKYSGIQIAGLKTVAQIKPNEEAQLNISLKADQSLKTGQEKFTLQIIEKNGFDLDPEKVLVIPTREFQPPKVELVDYGIEDQNRNLKIEKREPVDLIFRIQNKGETTSFGTYAIIKPGENVLALDIKDKYMIDDLESGEYKDIKASIVTNSRATEVNVKLDVFESSGKYGFSKTINLPFNIVQKKPEEIIVAKGIETNTSLPSVVGLKLDIAENIPIANEKKPDAVAVIIGNRDYSYVYDVDYAVNDAALIKNYVEKAFGYSSHNIIYLENASQAEMLRVFGSDVNIQGSLYDYIKKGKSDVFVYYSGHGAPDPNTKQGYIVPVDCDPDKVSLNGYSLKTLYKNLDRVAEEKDVQQLTVVLDACFSGESAKGNLLENISPIYITVNQNQLTFKNSALFTSSQGDQVSNWYPDKRQGLFTYFFLKGLTGDADFDNNKSITTDELHQYVADEVNGVPYWSRRISGRTQNPQLMSRANFTLLNLNKEKKILR
jgi:hypothetical protein